MEYTTLGKTGLKVSVVGLGCGGFSRIGQRAGKSEAESVSLVREALDMGINFLDTADMDHLKNNVASVLKPALPAADLDHTLFGALQGVGLDAPKPTVTPTEKKS